MSLRCDTLPKFVHQGQGMQQEGEARRPECTPLLPLVDDIRKVWAELSTTAPSTVFEHSNIMFLARNVYETNRAATKQDQKRSRSLRARGRREAGFRRGCQHHAHPGCQRTSTALQCTHAARSCQFALGIGTRRPGEGWRCAPMGGRRDECWLDASPKKGRS